MAIRVLDKNTAEQIAAGEVIENPAAVVKELVENALDAGSTRIEVEISGGGKSAIIVTDNGQGISAPEVSLAFQRFATSKLSTLDDLYNLSSLGFRGEALPSIAAVARVSLTTRTEGSISGSQIVLAGGEILKKEEVGAPPGTRVTVNNLFYNTPGRLKFLRADAAETARISALLSEFALANPGVAFNLTSGKRKLFSSSGDGILLHAIASVYGNNTAESMLEVNFRDRASGCNISGYISAPHLTRSSRRWITLIVNGRLIKNQMITNALERGYGDYLPRQRHPLTVLHLLTPPQTIDVNVHPTKVEIRFQEPELIRTLIYRAVKLTLQSSDQLSSWPQNAIKEANDNIITSGQGTGWKESTYFGQPIHFEPDSIQIGEAYAEHGETGLYSESVTDGDYKLIGQYLHSYLVVQKNDDLLLIDQHAAHERIIYQQLLNIEQSTASKQDFQLTIPQTFDLPTAWRSKMPALLPLLNKLGFDLETIGDDSYIIRAVPFVLSKETGSAQLNDILEMLFAALDDMTTDYRETILKTISCQRAVKAKQPLTRPEMEKLLSDWQNTPRAQYCPHGRPTVISFNRTQLEKSFNRKGS
jgi:DNA mismatch repair protein MutL